MQITEVEIHEFTYQLTDVGMHGGHQVYQPGSELQPPGFILSIKTDNGIAGHYRGFMFTPMMLSQIKSVAGDFLIDRDPLQRERIWQDLWLALRHTDHLGIGPIDIALWDLGGKHYGSSISTLLGGYRERVPAYASTYFGDSQEDGLSHPAAYASFAEECLNEGYPAFKMHTSGEPRQDIETVLAVAKAVGDRMDLMLDPASEYETYADALRVGKALDEAGYFWYEDPLADTGKSLHLARKLVGELHTPILGHEHVRTGPFGRGDHIAEGALDMVRADAHLDGGITSVMKIAHLAEAFGLDVELHLGGPSHLHCMSAIRNTNYFERGLLHPKVEWMSNQGFSSSIEQIDNEGTIAVPDDPGLGVEIDWEFVEENLTRHQVIDTAGGGGIA